MHSEVEDWMDMLLLVLMLGASLSAATPLANEWQMPIAVEISDKTIVKSSDLFDTSSVETGQDILNMLMVVDENTPYPRAFKIDDGAVIKIDVSWIASRDAQIASILTSATYGALRTKLTKKVESINYVYTGPDAPYWQYKLED